MNLILLGAPGAGKGTQAEVISQALNIPQISTGNMLREAVRTGTEYGVKAKAAMDSGALVSDDIVIGILKERIAQDDCKAGFILDGFPRSVPQAEALDQMGVRIDLVVSIEVRDEAIVKRMSGRRVCDCCGASYHVEFNPSKDGKTCDKDGTVLTQRKDDQPEVVLDRLSTYHQQTEPIKSYYKGTGKLRLVDGEQPVSEVTDAVFATIDSVQ